MIYADYAYYRESYKGKMEQTEFDRLSRPASAYLDQATLGRTKALKEIPEAVKDACCAVADAMYQQEQGGEVVSATNDGYSETYVTSSRTPEQKLLDAVRMYLGNTGLMYRGVD